MKAWCANYDLGYKREPSDEWCFRITWARSAETCIAIDNDSMEQGYNAKFQRWRNEGSSFAIGMRESENYEPALYELERVS